MKDMAYEPEVVWVGAVLFGYFSSGLQAHPGSSVSSPYGIPILTIYPYFRSYLADEPRKSSGSTVSPDPTMDREAGEADIEFKWCMFVAAA